jgi:iron-sulfur cluster assembly protein
MVTLTEKAAQEVQRIITEQQMDNSMVLRIGVAAGGCSGFQYRLGLDQSESIDDVKDHVVEQHGVKLAIDKKSFLYLDGTTIDFYDGIEKRGFSFENPNVVKSCGCGSSFQA